MDWIPLTTLEQIEIIRIASNKMPQVIFKHSTRCSISSMAKNRLEQAPQPNNITFYYVNVIAHRDISNKIAGIFNVHHESPQILLIKNGACTYNESHTNIQMEAIMASLQKS